MLDHFAEPVLGKLEVAPGVSVLKLKIITPFPTTR